MMTLLLVSALAACAPQGGAGRFDPSRPLSAEYLQIVSVDRDGVEVDASGRIVRAKAPKGLCIPVDSVQTSDASVFLLMRDCSSGSRPLNGVLSLSISNGPVPGGMEGLAAFLLTDPGRIGLGYGGDLEDVTLLDMHSDQRAVYALVEDRSEFGPAFAGDIICRAFVELNERMAVVSLISRRDVALDAAAMRQQLNRIVADLQDSNA